MIFRHTPEQVAEYYENIGLNQSSIKVLIRSGIQAFLANRDELQRQSDLFYEEKEHFIIGSGVDCIISYGEEMFKQLFHASTLLKKPGDKAMSVIQLAYAKAKTNFPLGPDEDLSVYREEVYQACEQEGFYMNRRKDNYAEDNRIATLLKDNGNSYWIDLIAAEGKQILSDTQKTLIDMIIMSLLTHKFTKSLFKDDKDIDIVFQFPMYWTYDDVDCKGLMDIIIINHATKKIFPIDLKTIGDYVTRFNRAVKKYRYDIQGSYYTEGLTRSIDSLATLIDKSLNGYEIANFAFVVESTIRPICPLIFPLTDELLHQGKVGDMKDLLGWQHGIERYKDWQALDFNIEKKVSATNGVLFIDENFEYPINL